MEIVYVVSLLYGCGHVELFAARMKAAGFEIVKIEDGKFCYTVWYRDIITQ